MLDETYLVGEVARLRVRAVDMNGQAVDPGSVTLLVRVGSGPVTTIQAADIVRDGTGVYRADIVLASPGQWAYRWQLSAPNAGAAEGVINVQRSRVL